MRTNMAKTSMELFQSPQKSFYVRQIQDDLSKGFAPIGWICRRMTFFWGGIWNSSMEVLVLLVPIRIFKNPNSSLTIDKRTMFETAWSESLNSISIWTHRQYLRRQNSWQRLWTRLCCINVQCTKHLRRRIKRMIFVSIPCILKNSLWVNMKWIMLRVYFTGM